MMNRSIAQFGLGELAKKIAAHSCEPADPMRLADHWQMHPWQAMQILNSIFLEIEQGAEDQLAGKPGWSFEHIRVVEDPHMSEDVIHLRDKDENVLIEFRNVGSLKHEHR